MSEVVPVENSSFTTKHPFRDTWQSVGRGAELPLSVEVGERLGQLARHVDSADFPLLGVVTLPWV